MVKERERSILFLVKTTHLMNIRKSVSSKYLLHVHVYIYIFVLV